jgi:hypothetical protein
MLQRLWISVLLVIVAYSAVGFFFIALQSFLSTETLDGILNVLGLVLLVFLPTMTGVAASAARQAGARTPHPALAVLFVIGAGFLAYVLGVSISPDVLAETEAVLLLNDIGGERLFRYGFALLLSGFFLYIAALAPVVALSKALKDRFPGDPLYRKTESDNRDAAPILYESVHVGWDRVLLSALILGMFDVVAAGVFGVPARFSNVSKIGLALFWVPWACGKLFDFLAKNVEFNKPIMEAVDTPIPEPTAPRGFRWWCFFIIGSFVVAVLIVVLSAVIGASSG